MKPRKIWFDDTVQRLNVDERGDLLGEFRAEDRILIATQSGKIKVVIPDLTMHFENDMIVLEKWNPKKPISAVYFDGNKEKYYVKRFLIESIDKEEIFISDHEKSKLEIIVTDFRPRAEIIFSKRSIEKIELNFEEFITIKGIKALGNQLTSEKIRTVNLLESLPYVEPQEVSEDNEIIEETELEDGLVSSEEDKSGSKEFEETKEDKSKKALERALQKKKKNISDDDESQTALF